MENIRGARFALELAALFALASCGGGGGAGSPPAPAPSPAIAPAPAPAPAPAASSTLALFPGQVISGQIDLHGGAFSMLYPLNVVATGGHVLSGYSWTPTPGHALPNPAISISPLQGVVNGRSTSLTRGTFTMFVDVNDDTGTVRSGQVTIDLTTTCDSSIGGSCSSAGLSTAHIDYLPAGTVGSEYAATIVTGGGTPPYSWALASGALPPGIVIDAARGVLRGTPTIAGTYHFYIRATDAANTSTNEVGVLAAQFTLVVHP